MYIGKYPWATVDDYQREMNREVTFEEFKDMFISHIWEEMHHNPNFTHQIELLSDDVGQVEELFASTFF